MIARLLAALCVAASLQAVGSATAVNCSDQSTADTTQLEKGKALGLHLDLPHHPRRLLVSLSRAGHPEADGHLRGWTYADFSDLGLEKVDLTAASTVAILTLPAPGGDDALIALATKLRQRIAVSFYVEADVNLTFPSAADPSACSPLATSNWALDTIGAKRAWELTPLEKTIVVAVLDSGIDIGHPSFAGQLDPRLGWDFVADTNQVVAYDEHGTNVSGALAGAEVPNQPARGVAPNGRLLTLIVRTRHDRCLSYSVKAISFAVEEHVDVINYSGSMVEKSPALVDALDSADGARIPVVLAVSRRWPCEMRFDNMICVISTTKLDALGPVEPEPEEEWWKANVDVGAPGECVPVPSDGTFTELSYPSIAAPQVAGVAALLRARCPRATASWIRKRIVACGAVREALRDYTISGARLDAARALDVDADPCGEAPPLPGACDPAPISATSR